MTFRRLITFLTAALLLVLVAGPTGVRAQEAPSDDPAAIELDSDSDGLMDEEELEIGTDPNNADSDTDRLSDGFEVREFGTNPSPLTATRTASATATSSRCTGPTRSRLTPTATASTTPRRSTPAPTPPTRTACRATGRPRRARSQAPSRPQVSPPPRRSRRCRIPALVRWFPMGRPPVRAGSGRRPSGPRRGPDRRRPRQPPAAGIGPGPGPACPAVGPGHRPRCAPTPRSARPGA